MSELHRYWVDKARLAGDVGNVALQRYCVRKADEALVKAMPPWLKKPVGAAASSSSSTGSTGGKPKSRGGVKGVNPFAKK